MFMSRPLPPETITAIDARITFTPASELVECGKSVDPKTDRYQEIIAAAEIIASQITVPSEMPSPDTNFALVNRFIKAWNALDVNGEPKSAFEIYRMFAINSAANDLLRQVRVQFASYIQGETRPLSQ